MKLTVALYSAPLNKTNVISTNVDDDDDAQESFQALMNTVIPNGWFPTYAWLDGKPIEIGYVMPDDSDRNKKEMN